MEKVMCYYITGILPKKVELDKLNSIKDKYNMRLEPNETMMVDKYKSRKSLSVRCTESDCDCGTPLLHGDVSEYNEDELIKWFFAIKELLTIKKMKYFGIVIQWIDQDKTVNLIKKQITLNINKVTYLDLCKLEVDILYLFK